MERSEKKALDLMTIIVRRGLAEKIAAAAEPLGLRFLHIVPGRGTAKTEWMELFSLGDSEKDLLFGTAAPENVPEIYALLGEKFGLGAPGKGIAFTAPVASLSGAAAYRILSGKETEA